MLIVIDGLDGSGKATQTRRVAEALVKNDIPLRTLSFPDYDSDSSALIRMYLRGDFGSAPGDVSAYAASTFFAVDRYASYRVKWAEDYQNGTLILCDRYTTSNIFHQMAKLPRADWEQYIAWATHYEYELLGIPRPDLVLYLDMAVSVSQRLLSERYQNGAATRDIHEKDTAYLSHCRDAALYAAKRLRWTIIPCAEGESPLAPEEITKLLLNEIRKVLK